MALEHFTLEMPGKDLLQSLPPNGPGQALLVVRRPFEELSALGYLLWNPGVSPSEGSYTKVLHFFQYVNAQ